MIFSYFHCLSVDKKTDLPVLLWRLTCNFLKNTVKVRQAVKSCLKTNCTDGIIPVQQLFTSVSDPYLVDKTGKGFEGPN